MHKVFVLACLLLSSVHAQKFTGEQYAEDFLFLWQNLADNYAYFDQRHTDWDKVKAHYLTKAEKITSTYAFVGFLEQVLNELYDNHTHLNTNTDQSPPLIPSGTAVHVAYENGDYVVKQLRIGTAAAEQLKIGDLIVSVNDKPLNEAIKTRWPLGISDVKNAEVHTFLANQIVACDRGQPRNYRVKRGDETIQVALPVFNVDYQGLLSSKKLSNNIGYIRIHDSLGNFSLVSEFDHALDKLNDVDGLILDLRSTPSGGNTTVARGLMGRLISQPAYYQEHSIPAELKQYGVVRRWTEKVYPRGRVFSQPMVVLADRWTGSMGEGMTIGLHGMGRATVIGAPMAGLLGGQYNMQLPNTGIGVNYIAEKLFHVDGTPREQFKPMPVESDQAIQKATELLRQHMR